MNSNRKFNVFLDRTCLSHTTNLNSSSHLPLCEFVESEHWKTENIHFQTSSSVFFVPGWHTAGLKIWGQRFRRRQEIILKNYPPQQKAHSLLPSARPVTRFIFCKSAFRPGDGPKRLHLFLGGEGALEDLGFFESTLRAFLRAFRIKKDRHEDNSKTLDLQDWLYGK